MLLTQERTQFSSLIEGVVYHIADTECFWQGDPAFEIGVFAKVYLDAKALAILEFMIPDAKKLPRHWVVQKFPAVRVIPFSSSEEIQEKWIDVLFEEQTRVTMELFSEENLYA